MACQPPGLKVVLSPDALRALDEIWEWNASHYGIDHADRYVAFLLAETNKLAASFFRGKAVPTLPTLSYIVIRRRRKGHGHLAVYERVGDVINVLQYFHTAQDWQTKMADEFQA